MPIVFDISCSRRIEAKVRIICLNKFSLYIHVLNLKQAMLLTSFLRCSSFLKQDNKNKGFFM